MLNIMVSLIWNQTLWHYDGVPQRIFEKVNFDLSLIDFQPSLTRIVRESDYRPAAVPCMQ